MTVGVAEKDIKWMRRALALARRGWGRTSPNPMVGAVVVRNGEEIGHGWHRVAGGAHAEVDALREAGEGARDAVLYVTLEPCSSTGRTPPCTDAIVKAGIGRVVVGCRDPNPAHAGKGIELLRRQGIEVTAGVEEEKCVRLNEAFFCWIREDRPFVMLKMATTLDGKIAAANGDSKWVTGEKARRRVQRFRQWADAVMVGGETVRVDNPSLTVRSPRNWPRQPRKLVWTDRSEKIGRDLNIFAEAENPPGFCKPETSAGWASFLRDLGRDGITALLLEGGGELAANALACAAVDKIAFFYAPKILGGKTSRPVVGGTDPANLCEAVNVRDVTTEKIGDDILMTGYPVYVHGTD